MSDLAKYLDECADRGEPNPTLLRQAASKIKELETRIKRMEEVFGTVEHMASDMQDPARQRGPSYPVDKAAREFHPERYRG